MKAFIIYLPQKEHSAVHAESMYKTLQEYGFDTTLFSGCPGDHAVKQAEAEERVLYPYSMKAIDITVNDLEEFIIPDRLEEFKNTIIGKFSKRTDIGDDREKSSLPGVIGCFYSHYELWKMCAKLKEPIFIFEDDVVFFRNFEPIEWDDVLIVSLGKSSFYKEPYKTFLENPKGHPQPISWKQYSMPGASGYAIKPKAAQKLVKFYQNYFYPADNAINSSIVDIKIHSYIMGRNKLEEEGNISMTRNLHWL